jgi:hypothetical protein
MKDYPERLPRIHYLGSVKNKKFVFLPKKIPSADPENHKTSSISMANRVVFQMD